MLRASALATAAAMDLVLLPEDQYGDGGRCLDGSMAAYYYEAPPSGSSDLWVVNLKGGGACHDKQSCTHRATTALGSSKSYAKTMKGKGLYSSDPSANPDFYDAHHVFVPYCTGDVHAGQVVTPTETQWGFYFSGHSNLVHIFDHIFKTVPAVRASKQVLLTGGSAGGAGTILNCDWLQDMIAKKGSPAQVKCAPIAGWFFPGFTEDQSDPEAGPSDWAHWSKGQTGNPMDNDDIRQLYQMYLHDGCVQDHQDKAFRCGSASNVYPYIKTPMYVMENQYDTNQLTAQLGLPHSEYTSDGGKGYIAYFGRAMRNSTAQVINHPFGKKGDGLFLPSCLDHGIGGKTTLQGHHNLQGLGDWFYGRARIPHVLVDDCQMQAPGLPCNPTCDSVPSGGGCKEEVQQLCGDKIASDVVGCETCAQSFRAELIEAGCKTRKEVKGICNGNGATLV